MQNKNSFPKWTCASILAPVLFAHSAFAISWPTTPPGETEKGVIGAYINSLDDLVFTNGGNVGIGTSNPTSKLDVNGNTKITGNLDVNAPMSVDIDSGTTVGISGDTDVDISAANTLSLEGAIVNVTGGVRLPNLANCNTIDTDAGGNLACGVDEGGDGADNDWANAGTGSMNTANLGDKVGIGLAAPNGKLHVKTTSDMEVARFEDENGNKVVVTKDGKVGIGTVAPFAGLEIAGDDIRNPKLGLDNTAAGGEDWYFIATDDTWVNGGGKFVLNDGPMAADNTFLSVENNGRVGINTINSTATLEVRSHTPNAWQGGLELTSNDGTAAWVFSPKDTGPLNGKGLLLSNNGGGNILTFANGGNVAIDTGAANPSEKLEVGGGVKVSTALAAQAGTIQWDGNNFQGHDGAQWVNLDAAGGGDNLGDHIANQNIQLNGKFLSNDGGDEGIRVLDTGLVGIGISNPTTTLEIKAHSPNAWAGGLELTSNDETSSWVLYPRDTQALNGKALLLSNNGGGNIITFADGGNVAIDTDVANPSEKLEVGGGVKVSTALAAQAGTIQWDGNNFQGHDGNAWVNLDGGVDAANFIQNQNAVDQVANFRIDGEGVVMGNMGIGITPSGSHKLDVDGNIQFNGELIRQGSTAYGTNKGTHINLGTTSKTGLTGQNYSYATVAGGQNNEASNNHATVGGGDGNVASGDESTISGGKENTASGDNATVGGGWLNVASGFISFIGGGENNEASENYTVIGGGKNNVTSNDYSVVAGGFTNIASGMGSSVVGGESNTSSGQDAFVGGGTSNIASGIGAVVSGGLGNTTAGDYSQSGGKNMSLTADADNTFLWGHSAEVVNVATSDAFIIYSGKVGIGVVNPGAKLEVDGGIKMANSNNAVAGTLRWDGNNFQGHNGVAWVNLGDDNDWIGAGTGNMSTANIADKVGIGVAVPDEMLEVESGGLKTAIQITSGAFGTAELIYSDGVPQGRVYYDHAAGGGIRMDTGIGGANNTDALYIASAGGEVGIGTNVPTEQLDINSGAARSAMAITSNAGGTREIMFNGGATNGKIYYDAAGAPAATGFRVDSGANLDALFINGVGVVGEVGVGTNQPRTQLHVSNNTPTTAIEITSALAGNSSLNFSEGPGAAPILNGKIYYDHAGADKGFHIDTGAVDAVYVDDVSGDVGMGTDAPSSELEVKELVNNDTGIKISTKGNGTSSLYFDDANGSNAEIYYDHGNDYMVFRADGVPVASKMYIEGNSGYVGIFNADPDEPLDVGGDVMIGGGVGIFDAESEFLRIRGRSEDWFMGVQNEAALADSDFFIGLSNVEDGIFHIQQDGNIGIGTPDPGAKLNIKEASSQIKIEDSDGGSAGVVQVNDSKLLMGNWANGGMLAVDLASDFVGIGTVAPEGKLHVKSSTDPEILGAGGACPNGYTWDDIDANVEYDANECKIDGLIVMADGNVGIGTNAPLKKLHIADPAIEGGFIMLENTSGTSDQNNIYFRSNGVDKWSFFNDYNQDGGQNFVIRDETTMNSSFFANGSGQVGINTSDPQEQFQVQSSQTAGTGSLSSTGITVTGSGTSFNTELEVGDEIRADDQTRIIASITDDTNLTVNNAFDSDLSGASFEYSIPLFTAGVAAGSAALIESEYVSATSGFLTSDHGVLQESGTTVQLGGYSGNTRDIGFYTQGVGNDPTIFLKKEDENVGIGTITPNSALQVEGYIQLDTITSAPPSTDCDEAVERGRMKVDSTNGLLYVCVDSGWVSK